MADSMCGPSNAAKGLTRHLDQDRSLQRDRFTGPSGAHDVTQGFRNLRLGQNTEFSSFQHQNAVLPGPLHHQSHNELLQHSRPDLLSSNPLDWAKQFNQRGPVAPSYNLGPSSIPTTTVPTPGTFSAAAQPPPFSSYAPNQVPQHLQQAPRSYALGQFSQGQFSQAPHPYLSQPQTTVQGTAISAPGFQDSRIGIPDNQNLDFDFDNELRAWCAANGPESQAQANEFLQTDTIQQGEQAIDQQSTAPVESHRLAEPALASLGEETAPANVQEPPRAEEQTKSQGAEDSELAQAAQQILDSVSNNESAKFRESAFMQMMRKIAAQDLVVRNNALVDAPQAAADAESGKTIPKPATVEDEFAS